MLHGCCVPRRHLSPGLIPTWPIWTGSAVLNALFLNFGREKKAPRFTPCFFNKGLVLFSFLQWTSLPFILNRLSGFVFLCQDVTVEQITALMLPSPRWDDFYSELLEVISMGVMGKKENLPPTWIKITSKYFLEQEQRWKEAQIMGAFEITRQGCPLKCTQSHLFALKWNHLNQGHWVLGTNG